MTSYWCERAIVDGIAELAVRIEERGGIVTLVQPDAAARDGDRRLTGLVLPGLANAHSHAFHRVLRGRTHGGGGTFWTWRDLMYRAAARLDPDRYFDLASAVFSEMVLAGYTLVGEFHYPHRAAGGESYDPSTAMEDAVLAAASLARIRITLLDTLYLNGGVDARGVAIPLGAEQQRFSDGSLDGWDRRRSMVRTGPLARLGAAVHSVRAVDPTVLESLRERVDGIPLHAHVSEQPAENESAFAAWGKTPTRLLADAGLLGPLFTAVHGTHLTDDDISLLGESSSTVCVCPSTERDLADGIGPASALLSAGVGLSLGSDQHAIIDPFEEMRGLEMDDRLATGKRGRFAPAQLLDAASASGYASLGWNGGRIAVGAVCDLVVVAGNTPRTAGASPDQIWLAATAADVDTVVVGGRVVVDGSTHPLGDVGAAIATAIERIDS